MAEPGDPHAGDRLSREGLVLTKCSSISEELFDLFYRDVIEPAFPPEELSSIELLRTGYVTPDSGSLGIIALRGHDPVGGMLGEHLTRSGVLLLAYLAVRPDQRGTGLGRMMVRDVLPMWRESFMPQAILAEIEDPRCHKASPYGDPVARLRFYERIGAKLLPLPYFQPSLGQGLPRVRGMFLICLDAQRSSLPGEIVRTFLDENIAACENLDIATPDPEYRALRSQAEAWRDVIPLWPLSRAAEVRGTEFEAPTRQA